VVRERVDGYVVDTMGFAQRSDYMMCDAGGGVGVEGQGFFDKLMDSGWMEDVKLFLRHMLAEHAG
jgi:hypothetical protein